ncbi:MAG: SAM-dependent methyltransferase [Bacteroidales bacterium]
MNGNIYLIPVTLGGEDFNYVIPAKVISLTRDIRYFIVEEIRSARRYLRLIDKAFPIDESHFELLNEHTGDKDISNYIEPCLKGFDLGLMSEAGLPGIADPGARLIKIAHRRNIRVIPLSGPSSIIMALTSSGLNGQNFTFNGYLPVKQPERESKLKELEKRARDGFAQIFIETPYRNQKMLESILEICNKDLMLCIAADISLPSESILTMSIYDWKTRIPDLKNRLVVFILQ